MLPISFLTLCTCENFLQYSHTIRLAPGSRPSLTIKGMDSIEITLFHWLLIDLHVVFVIPQHSVSSWHAAYDLYSVYFSGCNIQRLGGNGLGGGPVLLNHYLSGWVPDASLVGGDELVLYMYTIVELEGVHVTWAKDGNFQGTPSVWRFNTDSWCSMHQLYIVCWACAVHQYLVDLPNPKPKG